MWGESSTTSGGSTSEATSTSTTGPHLSSSSHSPSSGEDASSSAGGSETRGSEGPTSTGATGSSSGDASGSGSTSAPLKPHCGDGVLDLAEGEECDLGPENGEDAPCSPDCAEDKIVFLTSEFKPFGPYPSTALEGPQADWRCQQHSDSGKMSQTLPQDNAVYRAWISTTELPARERITPGGHRYVNTHGDVVAQTWDDLLDGVLLAPLAYTEHGVGPYDAYVWTGTLAGGDTGDHCQDWSAYDLAIYGTIGRSTALDSQWTSLIGDPKNPAPCKITFPIYCIEDGAP